MFGVSPFQLRSLPPWSRQPTLLALLTTPCWNWLPLLPTKPSCVPCPPPTPSPSSRDLTTHPPCPGSAVLRSPPQAHCPRCSTYVPAYGGPTASMLRWLRSPVSTMCWLTSPLAPLTCLTLPFCRPFKLASLYSHRGKCSRCLPSSPPS